MGLRIRIGLLVCLSLAAVFTGMEALKTLRPPTADALPETVYAKFGERSESAEFYLKSSGGYVAVFAGQREREPVTVTAIEVSGLRAADRAMLERGIPVGDKKELLELLEDLGS